MKAAARGLILLSVLVILSLSCALPISTQQLTPSPTLSPTVPTATITPLPSATPIPSATPVPTGTPPPTATPLPVEGLVAADTINLREGPGTVFAVVGKLKKGDALAVLQRAQGDEWVFVQSGELSGWLSLTFIEITRNGPADLPAAANPAGWVIRGQVRDEAGGPVQGVVFAVTQKSNGQTLRTDATSGADGFFYAYLPLSAVGEWQVSQVGINCKSAIVDDTCQFRGSFRPPAAPVTLPPAAPLEFLYSKTSN